MSSGPRTLADCQPIRCNVCRARVSARRVVRPVASGGGKVDITKVGLNSIEDEVVKMNLMGKSRYMANKEWRDSSGRKGKVSVWKSMLEAQASICFKAPPRDARSYSLRKTRLCAIIVDAIVMWDSEVAT